MMMSESGQYWGWRYERDEPRAVQGGNAPGAVHASELGDAQGEAGERPDPGQARLDDSLPGRRPLRVQERGPREVLQEGRDRRGREADGGHGGRRPVPGAG